MSINLTLTLFKIYCADGLRQYVQNIKNHTAYFSLRDILPNVLIETKYHGHRIDIKLTMDVSQQFLSCYTNYWRDYLKWQAQHCRNTRTSKYCGFISNKWFLCICTIRYGVQWIKQTKINKQKNSRLLFTLNNESSGQHVRYWRNNQ